ncbi:sugar transferase [Clostridia bacterium]|nr:sugar transferase [Clostridia bacterium]
MYPPIKRLLDVVFAIVLIIPVSIIICICVIVIKLESKGSVFFIQIRPGYKGKLFKIYKLRTMLVEAQKNGQLLSDMDRMTKSGRIIRKLSIDELVQLWNVLKGDMSFIGPRPLLPEYLPLYSEEQMRRHDVRPGISGWAQVNGRNEISWKQKFERDLWYVDHINFGIDIKIFWMTIANVLKRQGINVGVSDTMQMFTGEGIPS